MCTAEVDVVVDDGPGCVGAGDYVAYLWTCAWGNGIVGAENQDVVCGEVGQWPVVLEVWSILVEVVLGIAVFVQEGECK